MTSVLTYFGGGAGIFSSVVLDDLGNDDITAISATSTEVITTQDTTGDRMVITGTGFTFSDDLDPTGGTVSSLQFQSSDGTTIAEITGISWGLVELNTALGDYATGDFSTYAALIGSGPLTINASGATDAFDMQNLELLVPLLTADITLNGSDYGDTLFGGLGDDTISPGLAQGDDVDVLLWSPGADIWDFSGASGTLGADFGFYTTDDAVTLIIDGDTNTGSASATGGTTTFTGINNILTSDDGSFITVSQYNDTITASAGEDGWLGLYAGPGSDTLNLTLSDGGTIRLQVYWDAASAVTYNTTTGTVVDGFGATDTLNITDNGGRLEMRGSDNDDTFIGSDTRESFITEQGDDTVDGGGGWDRIRYDRSGVGAVNVDLSTGVATGTWDGEAFTDSLNSIEDVRGSREDNDTITGHDLHGEYLNGRGGNDSIMGGGGNDTLTGDDGDDTLYGGADNDVLEGEDGDDDLHGGAGNDTIEGGDGVDALRYNDEWMDGGTFGVIVDAGAGTATDSFGDTDTFYDIEEVHGTGAGDYFEGSDTASVHFDGKGGNDTADGGNMNEVLEGGDGHDSLDGNGGSDTLTGEEGDDTLKGGSGNDSLDGGDGRDHLRGEEGDDTLDASGGTTESQSFGDIVTPGAGNDSIIGHQGAYESGNSGYGVDLIYEEMSGVGGVTVVIGANGSGTAVTGDGSSNDTFTYVDHIEGTMDGDSITGSDHAFESFVGEGGDDTFHGGDGFDMIQYYLEFDGSGGVNVNMATGTSSDRWGGTDTFTGIDGVSGTEEADTFQTSDDGDYVDTRGGDDDVALGTGDDYVRNRGGSDTITDAGGDDTVRYNDDLGDVTITGDESSFTVTHADGTDSLTGIEYLQFGDEFVSVSSYFAVGGEIAGTEGKDTLQGTAGDESIIGFGGADVIRPGGGNDTVDGGLGNDFLIFADLADLPGRGTGVPRINVDLEFGTAISHDLTDQVGFVNIERLRTTDFEDSVTGSAGDDSIETRDGADTVDAAGGQDTIYAGLGDDSIEGGDGDDVLIGEGGFDSLSGGDGHDDLDGMNGNDYLFGRTGNDNMVGGGGRDRLRGNNGDDTMEGGGKNDFLQGGGGADVFVFQGAWAKDYVKDFELGIDTIQINGGFDAGDVSFKLNKAGTAVIATVAGGGKIVFENMVADDLNDFADWDFLA